MDHRSFDFEADRLSDAVGIGKDRAEKLWHDFLHEGVKRHTRGELSTTAANLNLILDVSQDSEEAVYLTYVFLMSVMSHASYMDAYDDVMVQ